MAKKVIFGVILAILAIFMLIITAILTAILPLGFYLGAEKADRQYDDWMAESGPGDDITISGRIDEEAEDYAFGQDYYSYKLEGCDSGFLSSEDIGDEGDLVVVKIERDDTFGFPEVSQQYNTGLAAGPNVCCCCFSGVIFLVGILMVVLGIAKGGKKKKDKGSKKTKRKEEE